jgi:two-component system response regulator LytT
VDQQGRRLVLDSTLESISEELNPEEFFRINRAQIIHLQAIGQIHSWFNHRLKLDLKPNPTKLESVVSRDRVKAFKAWLDR